MCDQFCWSTWLTCITSDHTPLPNVNLKILVLQSCLFLLIQNFDSKVMGFVGEFVGESCKSLSLNLQLLVSAKISGTSRLSWVC